MALTATVRASASEAPWDFVQKNASRYKQATSGELGAIQGAAPSFAVEVSPLAVRRESEIERVIAAFASGSNGTVGSRMTATRVMPGVISLSSSSHVRFIAALGGARPLIRSLDGVLEGAGHHAARTLGASTALTPSTTQGGHPGWRGAAVPTTMAFSVLARAEEMIE